MIYEEGKYIELMLGDEQVSIPGIWDMNIPEGDIFWEEEFVVHGLPVRPVGYFRINEARLLIHPGDAENLRWECSKIGTELPVYTYFRIITPDGSLRIISLESIPDGKQKSTIPTARLLIEPSSSTDGYELAASERFSAMMLSTTEQFVGAGTWQINLHTHKTFYSANVYRIYGVIAGSLKAHTDTFRNFIHPDEKRIVNETFDKALRESIPFHLEYRILTGQGELRYIKQISKVARNEVAEKVLTGVIIDITEFKLNELALRDMKEMMTFQQNVLSATERIVDMGFWHLNLQTRKIFFSENFYRIYGLKPQSVQYSFNDFLDYVHAEDRPLVSLALQQALDKQIPPHLAYRINRADGKTRYLQMSGKVLVNASKEMVMIAVVEDCTMEQLLEKGFKKAKAECARLLESLQHVEEVCEAGSWQTNLQVRDLQLSRNFHNLFGSKPQAVPGLDTFEKLIHPDDGPDCKILFRRMFSEVQLSPLEFRIITPEGELRHLKMENRLVQEEGKEQYLTGTIYNMSGDANLRMELFNMNRLVDLLGDTSRDIYFITDLLHNIVSYNKRFTEKYGIADSGAQTRNLFEKVQIMNHPTVIENLTAALNGRPVFLSNKELDLANAYLDIHMLPLKDPDGNRTRVLTILQDVTLELNLKSELTKQLHLFQSLVENTLDCIIVLDENFHVMVWNKQCEDHFAFQKVQVLGKNVFEIFPAFRKDTTYDNCQRALMGQAVFVPAATSPIYKGLFEQHMLPLYNEKEQVYAVLWMMHGAGREQLLAEEKRASDPVPDADKWQ